MKAALLAFLMSWVPRPHRGEPQCALACWTEWDLEASDGVVYLNAYCTGDPNHEVPQEPWTYVLAPEAWCSRDDEEG